MALTNLIKNYTKIKSQTKALAASVTGTNVAEVASLTFNNLVIGKFYRITGVVRATCATTASNALLTYTTNGAAVLNVGMDGFGDSVAGGALLFSVDATFQAAATKLVATITASPSGSISGNGTKNSTFIQLEEIPNMEEVTSFT